MLELSGDDRRTMRLGFGGDTLNTSVYLSRLGVSVTYVTALGDDPFSDELIGAWRAEGIDTSAVLRVAGKLPGLYIVSTDAVGERSFHFWRGESAARGFFAAPGVARALDALRAADVLYLSLISFSILTADAQEFLLRVAIDVAARGKAVAVDTNYRHQAWPDPSRARELLQRIAPSVRYLLPTIEDEKTLFGDADAPACARRLIESGVQEVAVKAGQRGAWIEARGMPGRWIAPPHVVQPLDTTGAGDSFNAGYLAARLAGRSADEAARAGATLAARVIQHRGALIPAASMPSLYLR